MEAVAGYCWWAACKRDGGGRQAGTGGFPMTRQEYLDRIERLVDHIDRYSFKNCSAERRELENLRAIIDQLDAQPKRRKA
jgi:hypothetical protein